MDDTVTAQLGSVLNDERQRNVGVSDKYKYQCNNKRVITNQNVISKYVLSTQKETGQTNQYKQNIRNTD